jgi:hypothetical protein
MILLVTFGVSALDAELASVLELEGAIVTLRTDLKGIVGRGIGLIVGDGMNAGELGLDRQVDLLTLFRCMQHTLVPEEAFDNVGDLRIERMNIFSVLEIPAVGVIDGP